jgi:arabinogalactan oligomer/maltooligosaccharide transport system permease protein
VRAEVGRQLVAHEKTWDDTDAGKDPVLRSFRELLPWTTPMEAAPRMRTIWEPADLMLRRALRRGDSPEAAARAGLRRHRNTTRPAPEARNPTVFIILALLLLLVGMAFLGKALSVLRHRDVRKKAAKGWAWISPAMVGTVVLLFVPFAVGLVLALFAHRNGDWTFVGLANFGDILASKAYGPTEPLSFYFALFVTVLWTAVNLVLHVALGLAFALLLSKPALALRPIYRVALIVPWAVPNYITALIWKGMFHKQFGAINSLLEVFGFDQVSWFSSFWTAFFANICANAWLGFPFMMVVCLGALQSIPKDLYEAADVDGASALQKFRHITLPLLRPALLPAILIGTVWTFNQFNIVYLVSGGEPDNSTDILISEAYRWAFTRQEQYGYAAAYAALIFVLLLGWSAFAARMGRRAEAV